MGTKRQILKAIEELPDHAGDEDALDRLYLLYKVAADVALTFRSACGRYRGKGPSMSQWINDSMSQLKKPWASHVDTMSLDNAPPLW